MKSGGAPKLGSSGSPTAIRTVIRNTQDQYEPDCSVCPIGSWGEWRRFWSLIGSFSAQDVGSRW